MLVKGGGWSNCRVNFVLMNFELLTFLCREMIKLSIHMTCLQDESIIEYSYFVSKGGGYRHTYYETCTRIPPMSGLPTTANNVSILVVIH